MFNTFLCYKSAMSTIALSFALLFTYQVNANDILGTRATAMGGALRASASGSASVQLNPAAMSLSYMGVANAFYQYRGSDSAHQVSASMVDSGTNKHMAMGVFYNFGISKPTYQIASASGGIPVEGDITRHEFGLALSTKLSDFLLIGTTFRYLNISASVNEEAPANYPKPDISAFTMDLGGIIRLGSAFNLAVVGHNLIKVDSDFTDINPRSLGLGAAYAMGTLFLVEFDTIFDFSSDPDKVGMSYAGGLEFFFAQAYALRAGVLYRDPLEATYVSAGIALNSKVSGVEIGYRQQVDGGTETLLSFSINLYLQ